MKISNLTPRCQLSSLLISCLLATITLTSCHSGTLTHESVRRSSHLTQDSVREVISSDGNAYTKSANDTYGEYLDGVYVGLSIGNVNLPILLRKARAKLLDKYDDFSSVVETRPLVEIQPGSPSRCVVVEYMTRLGEPYWVVVFNSRGEIVHHEKGTAGEGKHKHKGVAH